MYCEHCGGTMTDDARYCSHCGGQRRLRTEPPAVPDDGAAYAPPPFEAQHLDPDLVGVVRPWVRYWARTFDMTFLFLAVGGILGVVAPDALDDKVFGNLFGFVCLAAWVLIEPLHLVSGGTTPGKWLFRTRVVTTDGRRLTYEDALMRSFRVWWRGMGVGAPIISLITLIAAHEKLTRNGVTSWDREGNFTVVHKRLGPGRVVAIAFVCIAICALIAWGMSLED